MDAHARQRDAGEARDLDDRRPDLFGQRVQRHETGDQAQRHLVAAVRGGDARDPARRSPSPAPVTNVPAGPASMPRTPGTAAPLTRHARQPNPV